MLEKPKDSTQREESPERTYNFENVPEKLKTLPQWVGWRYESRTPGGKPTKVPYIAEQAKQGKLIKAKSNDSTTWSDFETAHAALKADRSQLDGIGFCFSSEDGLVGVDLDHCFDENHKLCPWAREVVDLFSGTYIELSPSGNGLHIWCSGKAVKAGKRVVISQDRGVDEAMEIYDHTSPRYFTVTGNPFKE